MILTDKAKSDFLEWYGADERYFETTATKTEEYANVIEWLDSVFIPITITNEHYEGYYFKWKINMVKPEYSPDGYNTRLEATEEAIKKANKIYNSNPTQDFAQCEYCTCDFVTVKRDTKTDKGYCNECNKEVKE